MDYSIDHSELFTIEWFPFNDLLQLDLLDHKGWVASVIITFIAWPPGSLASCLGFHSFHTFIVHLLPLATLYCDNSLYKNLELVLFLTEDFVITKTEIGLSCVIRWQILLATHYITLHPGLSPPARAWPVWPLCTVTVSANRGQDIGNKPVMWPQPRPHCHKQQPSAKNAT